MKGLLRRDGALTAELVREPGGFGLGQVPSRLKPDATTSMFTVSNVSASDIVLLGSQTVGGNVDSNPAGLVEAFTFIAARTGQADSISLYVDAGSSATSLPPGPRSTVPGPRDTDRAGC